MRKFFGLAVVFLVLGLCPAVRAQTPTSPIPQATWRPNTVFAPLQSNNNFHGWTAGLQQMWSRVNPFPSRPRNLYPNIPDEKDQPGMKYLQEFGYRVAKPAQ